jgi:hypothetical protein
MGYAVTVTALSKFFMNLGTVRLAVAALAFRQLAVLRVTLGAGKS